MTPLLSQQSDKRGEEKEREVETEWCTKTKQNEFM